MDWPTDRAGLSQDDFLLAFVLAGDSSEQLPNHLCGVQLSAGRAVEAGRVYLDFCTHSRTPESWFTPGFNAVTVRFKAPKRDDAVRAGWQMVRPAAAFLSTYIRPPR